RAECGDGLQCLGAQSSQVDVECADEGGGLVERQGAHLAQGSPGGDGSDGRRESAVGAQGYEVPSAEPPVVVAAPFGGRQYAEVLEIADLLGAVTRGSRECRGGQRAVTSGRTLHKHFNNRLEP